VIRVPFLWALAGAVVALAVGSIGPAPAAPVPEHLMPRADPLCFPTRVGDRMVSVLNGTEIVTVVTRAERTADGSVVRLESEGAGGQRVHDHTVRVSTRGIEVLEYSGKKLDPTFWWVKLPHGPKNVWTDQLNGQEWTAKTIGWEEVEVPAGKFRAIHVQHISSPQDTTSYWFAPGLGCIKWADGTRERKLTGFTPGK
jgi:hypothetical protein